MFLNGSINRYFAAIVFLLMLSQRQPAFSQVTVMDSVFSFRAGSIKTGSALDLITKRTGYNFTYDSRLIDVDRKIAMDFRNEKLINILRTILLPEDSLLFSVIDRYIIISRPVRSIRQEKDSSFLRIASVSGVIKDQESGEPLSFATISLKNSGRGTVANNSGEFILNLLPEMYSDTLSVSYLGYYGREIPVDQSAGTDILITMRREFISIPEIIIRNQIPQEIISRARHKVPGNYGDSPVSMTGFYREGVLRKNELQTYSEAVLRIFKSSYATTFYNDQIKIYKSRKIENLARTDTLAIRLKAGLSTCLELDIARNIPDFISPLSIADYNYHITDIVTYDDESAYAIEFAQKESIDLPLFRGTIYINTDDFGIYSAEFEINPKYIEEMKGSFISSSSKGFDTWPVSVKYSVSYRKSDGRYFLSHVRGDLIFTSRQKRKLFRSQFNVFFELAITGTDLRNVKRFEKEELAPIHSVFSKTITSYDQDFWGDQDFLRPEENLIQALKNMKVRLQEFEE